MSRRWELDALRGLMLVLMTVTHLPTRLSEPLGQPLGFVSAAEGFVLLSAYMAGLVYSRVARKKSIAAMRQALWRRTRKVYACHSAMLLFLFTVVAAVGLQTDQPAVTDLMSFYLAHPLTAVGTGLLLIWAIRHLVAQPIGLLARHVEQLGETLATPPLAAGSGRDTAEFAALTHGINRMQARLSHHFAELTRLKDELAGHGERLEALVAERT